MVDPLPAAFEEDLAGAPVAGVEVFVAEQAPAGAAGAVDRVAVEREADQPRWPCGWIRRPSGRRGCRGSGTSPAAEDGRRSCPGPRERRRRGLRRRGRRRSPPRSWRPRSARRRGSPARACLRVQRQRVALALAADRVRVAVVLVGVVAGGDREFAGRLLDRQAVAAEQPPERVRVSVKLALPQLTAPSTVALAVRSKVPSPRIHGPSAKAPAPPGGAIPLWQT